MYGEMSPLPLILDSNSWESARGLLPDEILNRYRTGAWNHEIHEAPTNTRFFDDDLIAAGKRNDGHYTIGSNGQIIDLRTGKLPSYIYGPPFPTINPTDPHAGAKVVWNYFYQSYSLGNTDSAVAVDWVGTGGLERQVSTQVYLRSFDGPSPKHQPAENPRTFSSAATRSGSCGLRGH